MLVLPNSISFFTFLSNNFEIVVAAIVADRLNDHKLNGGPECYFYQILSLFSLFDIF